MLKVLLREVKRLLLKVELLDPSIMFQTFLLTPEFTSGVASDSAIMKLFFLLNP